MILKTTKWPDKLIFSKNNNNKLVSEKNNGNNKIERFSIIGDSMKYIKKLGKLFKLRKSKSKTIFKS